MTKLTETERLKRRHASHKKWYDKVRKDPKYIEKFRTQRRDRWHSTPGKAKFWNSYYRDRRDTHPEEWMLHAARQRATKRHRPFEIEKSDILAVWPVSNRCVDCGTEMVVRTRCAPSLDEIVPGRGYTPTNISVICKLCNTHKSDSSLEWFERVAARIRRAT
jgi:hypothetical protein